MKTRIAINGFGRIGRLFYRIVHQRDDLEIVAINDLVPSDNLAYLLKYDSVHGKFLADIESQKDALIVDNKKTFIFNEKDPTKLPWKDLKVDYVIESTGHFTKEEGAKKHIEAGAKRVIISAPSKDKVPTYVMGVNHESYDPKKDVVISNASCTTNCLAPIVKVVLDNFGIEEGLMTTIHSVTASQPVVDGPSQKDFRAGRSASLNIIPASTGAAKALARCIKEIEGKITGMAFRVPTIDVSVVDLTIKVSKDASYEEISSCMKKASETNLKGILGYTDEQVVSTDFIGSSYSSIFDKLAGIELNPRFFKLVAWYDNEMGYAHRLVDLVDYIAKKK